MQFEIFDNLLTAPRTVSNTYAQVAWAQSCAHHSRLEPVQLHWWQAWKAAVDVLTVKPRVALTSLDFVAEY